MLYAALALLLTTPGLPSHGIAPANERRQEAEASVEASDRAQAFAGLVAQVIDEVEGADVAEIRGFFSEEMAAALGELTIATVLRSMRDEGAVRISLVESEESGSTRSSSLFVFLFEQDETAWRVRVSIDAEGRVDGWLNKPAPLARSRVELLTQLASLQGDWGLSLVMLDAKGAALDRFEASSGRELFPLGSIFKLYVLAELARQVEAGRLELDAEYPIVEELKSLPSGTMHELAAGTPVSLRTMASQMIAISDNTATDHLIELVGRDAIEAHLDEYGNSDPDRNRPFLSTLEMFLLKGARAADRRAAFGAETLADLGRSWPGLEPGRRREALLDLRERSFAGGHGPARSRLLMTYGLATVGAPDHVEIEWMARPADIVDLVVRAERGELVGPEASQLFLEIYRAGSPQYEMDYVRDHGFKGGSETGVFALSTRVVHEDGRVVVVCINRCSFPLKDTEAVSSETISAMNAWIRNFFEGDPVPGELGEPRELEAVPGR